jgi:hypothetical protein
VVVPVPTVIGTVPDPPPENDPGNEAPPQPPAPPVTIVFPPASPAPDGNRTGNPPPEVAPAKQCVQPPAPEPPHVLIALENGWVYAAVAYWVDNGTLHYVTTGGQHNQVSLELVNRRISARLNQGSQMPFVLP